MEFRINHNNIDYILECDDGGRPPSKGHLRIHDVTNDVEITNQTGFCNPFVGFWNSPDALLTGELRTTKMEIIARETIIHEVTQREQFNLDVVVNSQ